VVGGGLERLDLCVDEGHGDFLGLEVGKDFDQEKFDRAAAFAGLIEKIISIAINYDAR
jgi:hypothetical protein